MRVCDYVYCLNFGQLLTDGPPDDVRNHPEVVAAYLGEDPDPAVGGPRGAARRAGGDRLMALLEVEDLRVGYGFPVLLGIDFEVEEGETAVLFGLNGAGKTTTLSTIAGLLKPDARHDPLRRRSASTAARRPSSCADGIALVPEGRRVFPALSVANNLRLGGWTRRRRRDELAEQRELVFDYFPRLAERADQVAGTLSGGEQQMLAIGRALMSKPRLLLIDEASLGLSPALAKTVFQVVTRINDDGVTVIIVEQNVGVLPYADRALIMEKGTLVFSGVGDEIRQAEPPRDATSAEREPRMTTTHHSRHPGGNHEEPVGQARRRPRHRLLRRRVRAHLPRLERRRVQRPRRGAGAVRGVGRHRRAGARRRRRRR